MTMPLQFETFSIDPVSRKLLVEGHEVQLGARAFDVLVVLAERYRQVVGKQTLMSLVWPNLVVEDNNLQVQIASLRKVLGKSLIQTVSGRGYCLAASLQPEEGSATSPKLADPQTTQAKERQAATPPTAGLATGNLPAFLPYLYGRAREAADLDELLRSHRLVTLTGAGGLGKTHLANSVGLAHKSQWRDGVWLLRAEECHDVTSLVAASMQCLGVVTDQDLTAQAALQVLCSSLQDKQLLLIVDNCEHILGAVQTLLGALLDRVAGLQVLATSQVPLRMSNEFIYQLDTLSMPSDSDSPKQALQSGAMQMFLGRLQQQHQRYTNLSDEELRHAMLICQRLDGMALALLLAAARVPLLGLQAVSEHVSECLDVLAASKPSAEMPERHQALKGVMEWTYRLLDPDEAQAFQRLGLLIGSFDLETAQHVLGGPNTPDWKVLKRLEALLNHGFLMAADGAARRYRLLQPHRLFALEKLQESNTLDLAQCSFAQAMLGLSDALIKVRKTDALWASLPSIHAAFEWACEQDEETRQALAMALAVNTAMLLLVSGRAGQALQHLQRVSPWVHLQPSRLRQAKYWQWLGRCGVHGRLPTSQCIQAFERAHQIYVELDNVRHAHACKRMLAEAHMGAGQLQRAGESLQDALALEGTRTTMADSMRRLRLQGLLAHKNGDAQLALGLLEEALLMAQAAQVHRYAVTMELDIARLYITTGELDKSLPILDRLQQTGVRHFSQQLTLGSACADLVFALLKLGDWERAAQICAFALPYWESSGIFARYGDLLAWWLLASAHARSENHGERTLYARQMLAMADRFFADNEIQRDFSAQHSHDQVMQLLPALQQVGGGQGAISQATRAMLPQTQLAQYLGSQVQSVGPLTSAAAQAGHQTS